MPILESIKNSLKIIFLSENCEMRPFLQLQSPSLSLLIPGEWELSWMEVLSTILILRVPSVNAWMAWSILRAKSSWIS